MRYEFYKILDKKYVSDFINGNLYMNTLNYFRNLEGNVAQGDPLEGVCGSVRKEQLKQIGLNFDEELVAAIQGNVSLISEHYGFNNLFCLYKLLIDDENKVVLAPSEELCKFNDDGAESKMVVRVTNTQVFLDRITDAIEKGIEDNILEYGICGSVIYSDSWMNANGPGSRSAFYKESSYSYQNEWRLCLLRSSLIDTAYTFSVGDLSDVTEIISLKEFLDNSAVSYPGYVAEKEMNYSKKDTYHIYGSSNAVNNLMFSYMNSSNNQPVRSDVAQADWHYSKYLQLTDRSDEIDEYLDDQMKTIKDLDHLELLVQHRLWNGEWVKATDAFLFFINEASNVIEEDPGRFFFPLHTILMQHKQAVDAGKLYKIATKDYDLPEDLKEMMKSDILIGLSFYDKTIPLYQKMKDTSRDPILDYYLAVSYLHILDFEKAHLHLRQYEQYFNNLPQDAKLIAQLRSLVDCFRSKKELKKIDDTHVFERLVWDEQLEQTIINTDKKSLFLGIEAIYKIEKADKWYLLDKFNAITICPATIAEMMAVYLQTGDSIWFYAILKLASMPKLEIKSPDLDYYITVDFLKNDFPPYIKMEQALFLQETNK